MARIDQKILIIDDDPEITKSVNTYLTESGYSVTTTNVSRDAMELIQQISPDLVILDIIMPEMDGIEICRRIRLLDFYIPIIMLSSKSDVVDKVVGLEIGADDYLPKPFSLRELEARIKAVLRRSLMEGKHQDHVIRQTHIKIGDILMDISNRIVKIGEQKIDLTPKEFELLKILMANPGKAFTRDILLEKIWGEKHKGYHRTIDSHINRLRIKIEKNPEQPNIIITVWGYGYKFNEDYQPNF